ncbi:RNA exonuclease [Marchantia polymorpha subsp. ruderalis]|uniref:Exonuclease domain-containing protein n=2 Tax=Marchantia polymorpha TaxID=3197 RepID=A0AAF6BW15_MARPO|nr:hypothetical protein MARPO_0062s0093 [Marchantia polymorpha]BBN16199.1 hypothetical protein Mp_7g04320 [Marchantia polymorpha subsp. ruderalis]|eukprot:PTQ36682.1 hypothetical protein MARPO_0062s0093 [Marchantia polymorpha]
MADHLADLRAPNDLSAPTIPASYYVLSKSEMMQHGYRMPAVTSPGTNSQLPAGFVMTQPALGRSFPEMVAVDCEMCRTAAGLELTRVSLVDTNKTVLIDSLVMPTNPILNYNTRYSGITAARLRDVNTTLKDIQEHFIQIVSAETILVGHSLERDLAALKVIHMKVIDTALLYQHPRHGGKIKPALRMLADKWLKRSIQNGSEGHDSIEDAEAAMDLTMLKIRKGRSWCPYW